MTHLSPAQAVDVAEGAAAPALVAHAASCDACRGKVEALREAARLAAEDPLPEPSPLFWPHLAARIGQAVRREQAPAPAGRPWLRRLAPAGALAALVLALAVGLRLWVGVPVPQGALNAPPQAPSEAPADRVTAGDAADDPSWLFVSDLSALVSLDEAVESGALPLPGGVEKALVQLDEAERVELARILREEMAALAPGEPQGAGA